MACGGSSLHLNRFIAPRSDSPVEHVDIVDEEDLARRPDVATDFAYFSNKSVAERQHG